MHKFHRHCSLHKEVSSDLQNITVSNYIYIYIPIQISFTAPQMKLHEKEHNKPFITQTYFSP